MDDCPFCGSDDLTVHRWIVGEGTFGHVHWDVRCEVCECHGPTCSSREQAISEWNARKEKEIAMPEAMLDWFAMDESTEQATVVSGEFRGWAHALCQHLGESPERTVALRRLLEAREAALVAVKHSGT